MANTYKITFVNTAGEAFVENIEAESPFDAFVIIAEKHKVPAPGSDTRLSGRKALTLGVECFENDKSNRY